MSRKGKSIDTIQITGCLELGWEKRMKSKGHEGSFRGYKNTRNRIVVMIVHIYKFSRNYGIVHLRWVNIQHENYTTRELLRRIYL